jgi:biopolymer transport protein ExbB
MRRLTPLVESRQLDQALRVAESTRGALGRVLATTLKNLDRPRAELEDVIDESVLHEQPTLDRFGNAIFVIAAVAPLLGLLGTVTGMIATFDIITEFGTGNPKLLSNGISIALVTTELGLIVAIPALLLGNFLNGWSEGIKNDLDRAALRVTNLAHGATLVERPRAGGAPPVRVDAEALAVS